MANHYLRRKSSVPAYLIAGENAVEVDEDDLRWRRSSQAALTALLPSHGAIHSDTGMVLSRAITDPARRKSIARRKSVAAIRGVVSAGDLPRTSPPTIRQLLKSVSVTDQFGIGEEDQLETAESIKRMTATLAVKRKYRDRVLSRTQQQLGGLELWKYQIAMTWLQFKNAVKNWIYQLELWAGHLKVIEGHFGTSTMTYFRFLRWLMFLNLFIAIIMLGVILLPFLVLKPANKPDFVSSVNSCLSEHHFLAGAMSQDYENAVKAARNNESDFQLVLDALQGTGWLENTELFYGSYFNWTVSVPLHGEHVYNMSLAYLLAVGAVFLLCFILLVKNSAKGLKEGVLTSSGGTITHYCNKVFGAWDFCIDMEKTATIRHKNILQELQSELDFQRLQWRRAGRTTKEKAKLYFVRFLVNILVLVILAGALYIIFVCFTNDSLLRLQQDTSLNEIVQLILQYIPSLVITVLNVIVPLIFTKVIIAEDYMPAFALRLTLTRTVLLRLASLGVLMGSLYDKLTRSDSKVDVISINTECDNLQPAYNTTEPEQKVSLVTILTASVNFISLYDHVLAACQCHPKIIVLSSYCSLYYIIFYACPTLKCWETYVGQQLYKLLILNFLIVVIMTFLVKFPRKLIYSKFEGQYKLVAMVGQQKFDLNKSVLDLVYLQALCWLGLFFSPIVPAMCCVMCFIFFYVQKNVTLTSPFIKHPCKPHFIQRKVGFIGAALMHTCEPVQQSGTSKSNSLFMTVLLLSFGLSAVPIVFMVGSISPSKSCGPFRVYSSDSYVMFDVITNLVNGFPSEVGDVLSFLGQGASMAVLSLLLCFLMYYFWAVGQANHKMGKLLREQLKQEGQDKQFLLARVNEVLSREEISEMAVNG